MMVRGIDSSHIGPMKGGGGSQDPQALAQRILSDLSQLEANRSGPEAESLLQQIVNVLTQLKSEYDGDVDLQNLLTQTRKQINNVEAGHGISQNYLDVMREQMQEIKQGN
jgi:hypothetical protein